MSQSKHVNRILAGVSMASALGVAGCSTPLVPEEYAQKADATFVQNARNRLVEAYRAGEIDISFQELEGRSDYKLYRTGPIYRLDADPANLAVYERRTARDYLYNQHHYIDEDLHEHVYPAAGARLSLIVTDPRTGMELCEYKSPHLYQGGDTVDVARDSIYTDVRSKGSLPHAIHREIADIARERLVRRAGTEARDVTPERAAYICEEPVDDITALRLQQMLVPSDVSGPSRPTEGQAVAPTNQVVSDGKGGEMLVPVVAGILAGRAMASDRAPAAEQAAADSGQDRHRKRVSRRSGGRRR